MEDYKKTGMGENEKEIVFSQAIKAGKRIYYIDVKQNRRGEMYLCITESKKMQSGSQDMPTVNYEKHKIFLFREDFSKFDDALRDAFSFVTNEQGDAQERQQEDLPKQEEEGVIKLDLDF